MVYVYLLEDTTVKLIKLKRDDIKTMDDIKYNMIDPSSQETDIYLSMLVDDGKSTLFIVSHVANDLNLKSGQQFLNLPVNQTLEKYLESNVDFSQNWGSNWSTSMDTGLRGKLWVVWCDEEDGLIDKDFDLEEIFQHLSFEKRTMRCDLGQQLISFERCTVYYDPDYDWQAIGFDIDAEKQESEDEQDSDVDDDEQDSDVDDDEQESDLEDDEQDSDESKKPVYKICKKCGQEKRFLHYSECMLYQTRALLEKIPNGQKFERVFKQGMDDVGVCVVTKMLKNDENQHITINDILVLLDCYEHPQEFRGSVDELVQVLGIEKDTLGFTVLECLTPLGITILHSLVTIDITHFSESEFSTHKENVMLWYQEFVAKFQLGQLLQKVDQEIFGF